MDELTMLVRLAGGESETMGRLRAAGLGTAQDLVRAGVGELRSKVGLPPAASRQLVRAARQVLALASGHKARSPRTLRTPLLVATSDGSAPGDERRESERVTPEPPAARVTRPAAPGRSATPPDPTGQGVSKEESSALTGGFPRDGRLPESFWRFG